MSDPVTRQERYGAACSSGRLSGAAADTVAAAGMAGRREPLGAAYWRAAYASDRAAYMRAQSLLWAAVRREAAKRKWPEHPRALRLLAGQVMRWSVFGVCARCMGRGSPQSDASAQVLAPVDCDACSGSGRTPITAAVAPALAGRARDIAQLLDLACDHMCDGVAWHSRGW